METLALGRLPRLMMVTYGFLAGSMGLRGCAWVSPG